jgi:phosphoribosylaminoimidazolecarboxamide formyltransferase/IMP cyclohydrolase
MAVKKIVRAARAVGARAKKPTRKTVARAPRRVVPLRPPLEVRRVLISVYDKEGVVELARGLTSLGVEVLTTGGTARLLIDNDVPVVRVADYTRFPEMLDGRVKTLHPKIHAGIMAVRDNLGHMTQMRKAGIPLIDLVVVNLYPFEKTAAMEGIGFDEIVEMIDIGGPTLVRAAAKNFRHVGVVVDPADYGEVLAMVRDRGGLSEERRLELATKAFRHIAGYDTAVFSFLSMLNPDGSLKTATRESHFPARLTLDFLKAEDLRYGENPHQKAAFYRDPEASGPSVASAQQIHGKELSFNNILDLDAAFRIACEFREPACALVKHSNPCGVGLGRHAAEAFHRALQTDPQSAFGGVAGLNVEVDGECVSQIGDLFLEAIIAPSFSAEAIERLRARKNLRLLRTLSPASVQPSGRDLKLVAGGLLVQDWDSLRSDPSKAKVVTRRPPSRGEMDALRFAWTVVRHVRSNAIVYATADRTIGIGAGQMSRVDSVRFGAMKAASPLPGSVLASDAFFPFRDSVDLAASHGVTAIVQPGGSIRDAEVISAADEHGLAMVFTGSRHFRH